MPPPISGGTLLISANGRTAIAADPDRDRVSIVDIPSKTHVADIQLEPSDEPGRIVEGAPGRVHVALRRGGAVATIDFPTRKLLMRTPVCPAPRGIAYAPGNKLHVACAGGELVTLSADTGAELRRLRLKPDLRDVVVQQGGGLLVSVFREAKVLELDPEGNVVNERSPFSSEENIFGFEPAVAWRMAPLAGGGAAIVHQRHARAFVGTEPGGYGVSDGCGEGIVLSAVSFLDATAEATFEVPPSIGQSALPVDLAISPDGSRFAIVSAGSDTVFERSIAAFRSSGVTLCNGDTATQIAEGQPVAVAFAGSMRVVQTREPPRLVLGDGSVIDMPGEDVMDTGHELFHRAAAEHLSLACASCHPEGREDGFTWEFSGLGPRRTQSLAGGILATAPLHWNGELQGFDSLMGEVFTGRMGGAPQSPRRVRAIALWVDSIPALPASPAADPSSVERGKALFESSAVGCATCHSGPLLTNNESVDVGTGGVFQVPSLRGVAARAPFMHNGCAPTLRDRFNVECGGDSRHGVTWNLTPGDLDDLVSYLETL
jgi:mono/diheme cytochrome c family protein